MTGPKAETLSILLDAGYHVPSGIAIGFNALNDHLLGNETVIDDLLDEIETRDPFELGDLPAKIRDVITSAALSAELEQELAQSIEEILAHGVSVRSSSSLEDRGNLSFAGQHDSYLNLNTLDLVAEKILAVWASTYSDRALIYLRSLNISVRQLQMGVVIQQMVKAETSGVAFSIHPVSGDRDIVSVSAAFGLGESTVAGTLTPDEILVSRTKMTVSEYRTGDKSVQVVGSAKGVIEEGVSPEQRSSHALAQEAVIEIAKVTVAIETLMGGDPQDVEWARDADSLWILQARPLVARPAELTIRWDSPVPGSNWRRNWRLGEWIPDAVTPLFASWMLPKLVASREEFGTGALGWKELDSFAMPHPWFCIVNGYFYTRQDFPAMGGGGSEQSLDERIEELKRSTRRIAAWRKQDLPAYVEHFNKHKLVSIESSTSTDLLQFIDLLVDEAGDIWSFLSPIGYGFEEMVFKPLYDRVVPGDKPHYSLLFSGYRSRMVDAQTALCDIAKRIGEDEAVTEMFAQVDAGMPELQSLPDWVQQAIEDYNAEYGHQVLSLDTYWPTLGETAQHVITSLQALTTGEVPDPVRALAEARERRIQAVAEVMERLRDNELKRTRFSASIDYYQGNAAVREDCNFYLQIGWPLIRRSLQAIGERLVEEGVLDTAEQIHFLEKEELFSLVNGDHAAISMVSPVTSRLKTWQNQRALIAPLTLSGEEAKQNTWDAKSGVLQAIGASPGMGRGVVRVVIDDDSARQFKKGEVLVISAASPLFTPLMLMASGLIVEVGGGASHSSLVARELGLPAVVNAENATTILKSGQEVEIDGEHGLVRLIRDS